MPVAIDHVGMVQRPISRVSPTPWLRLGRLLSRVMAVTLLSASAGIPARAAQDCFALAARTYRVNPTVLRAIAWQESRFRTSAIHHNANGTTDYGLMQVNSANLPMLGLTPLEVMRPCMNVFAGAYLYRQAVDKYGNTLAAVGAYHSQNPKFMVPYAESVRRILAAASR